MNRKAIMYHAWEIWHRGNGEYPFSLCLKMAWQAAKLADGLESLGGKVYSSRWSRGNNDNVHRWVFFNAETLGLRCYYYNRINLYKAAFRRKGVTVKEAREMLAAKTYVDLNDFKVHGENKKLAEALAKLTGLEIA